MKKTYTKPVVETMSVSTMAMLSDSNAINSNLPQVKYGGVDGDGELDPESRSTNVWDDSEDY